MDNIYYMERDRREVLLLQDWIFFSKRSLRSHLKTETQN